MFVRVIGILHVNAIYTGTEVVDFRPHRFEFLWVRWYEFEPGVCAGWKTSALDRLQFPPIANEGSFGFIDPAEVLRAAHIVPAFAAGKRYPDGKGLSVCAKDADDWKSYYLMQ